MFCARFDGAVRFVRGNTERALIEAAAKLYDRSGELTARERWLIEAHSPAAREAIEAFEPAVTLDAWSAPLAVLIRTSAVLIEPSGKWSSTAVIAWPLGATSNPLRIAPFRANGPIEVS